MILFIYQYLSSLGIPLHSVFTYSSTRTILAALSSLLCAIWIGPYCIRRLYALKTGQSIRVEDCPLLAELHQKKKETPTMGGIFLLFSALISLILWMDWRSSFTIMLCLLTLGLAVIGGIDDYLKMKLKNSKGMKARTKFLMQLFITLGICSYLYIPQFTQEDFLHPPIAKEWVKRSKTEGEWKVLNTQQYMGYYFVPFIKKPLFKLTGLSLVLGIFLSVFVITGSSNAVNLTDGLDGLASGCLIMVAVVLGIVAFLSNNKEMARYLNILYIKQSGEIAIYLFAVIGATLGFLWYNGFPAQVFMGDIGSLSLGGIIGFCAVLLRRELLLALVGGVFVAETLSVILQVGSYKLRNRKRIFLCTPLHHHFEYKGWPETKVVIRFWIMGLILALLGLVSLKFQ
ncbi:Phospho-N-acetylmuramoyl-pentapeptide- transferase [Candidatus Rhabdochlamydia oedothoracis]|uniref:Phospho-N-acetylmuramoyl-pentapeptide-transferase n=1 Tax=Candidatus Rhabdochlamydia oedothoracis TaxID=2720720 RepID=A0ABX8V7Y6_9BACT|nr:MULTISPECIES: phospho-N-acetylmuramoyl-pentapeptide-transferase [Rhabdochlamydia]KAG6558887.1 Phospho-N-acetylmuramoyl-pentapeptide-transferase [Candidatus Rhabdochlamydia sp. W815]MCL6756270.1 phospho-N-acetylmuramoyl-pentapeptide-transferase [Candidatus Rhabdochlamydia oedothoracis]QYF49133.1 Phospho-N-acetylmuramoyl-pentapeptide- transferase [Candidatus Rhabdochlamydia oedothoracis]